MGWGIRQGEGFLLRLYIDPLFPTLSFSLSVQEMIRNSSLMTDLSSQHRLNILSYQADFCDKLSTDKATRAKVRRLKFVRIQVPSESLGSEKNQYVLGLVAFIWIQNQTRIIRRLRRLRVSTVSLNYRFRLGFAMIFSRFF